MLKELRIIDFAIIDHLDLEFKEGLVILTGETGAGKSIVLQAIHLLSGGKASATWVRNGEEQAIIEALFEIDPGHSQLLHLLREKGFDSDGEIIIKRILSAKGRSRFYLNGSLSTARLTNELCENLLNVASQHDHQQLLIPGFQLDFLDSVAELKSRREQFADLYDHWQVKKKEFEQLRAQEMDKEQRRDFLNFQCKEISQAKLIPGEDLKLVGEKNNWGPGTINHMTPEQNQQWADKVYERIGRLKQKYTSVHKYYDITVKDNDHGIATGVSCSHKIRY